MSRLDSLIRRLRAQRACLAVAAELMADLPGPIFELGFGDGRTYDHLRALFPRRRVFVFERHAPRVPVPGLNAGDLILGDVTETLLAAVAGHGAAVPLIHSDLGGGDTARDARLAAAIAGPLQRLLAPGGVIVSDQRLPDLDRIALALPPGVAQDRYFLYRR